MARTEARREQRPGEGRSPRDKRPSAQSDAPLLSNADISDRLASLAQLLSTQKENPYKVRAYQRASTQIRTMSESIDELVRSGSDLTRFSGIGDAIASAIGEIVRTGSLGKLEKLRSQASPELAAISAHPRLDPKRVLRIYKKLNISSIEALRTNLETGELEKVFGLRMAQHIRQGLTESHAILFYRAEDVCAAVNQFLLERCGVTKAAVVGDYRRKVEVIEELAFIVATGDFASVISRLERYGGRTPLVSSSEDSAMFALSSGILLHIQLAKPEDWGTSLIRFTGSKAHLRKLNAVTGMLKPKTKSTFPTEDAFFQNAGLEFIEPELREGNDEVERAVQNTLPVLVTAEDVRGELHAHSTASDGGNSIEQMASAAKKKGYEYIGITDHSQSLTIAGGVPVDDLWKQIRTIDKLNQLRGDIRILKSSEVDILADGSLDYPDDLLRELDYTVCSIHSRFGFDKARQTERIMRAMDNRYFNILGHATGRLLLKRPEYEIDVERVIGHARQNGCFFEINSSPERLDLSAENARLAAAAGVKIAITTDAHSTGELDLIAYGINQARRAGLDKSSVLNCFSWAALRPLFKR